jgi:hypothetical protein
MQQSQALANLLDGLAATLKEAAVAARGLSDDGLDDLPPVLNIRHVAKLENQSVSTIWRRVHQGEAGGLPPTIDPPRTGKPNRWYREVYLAHRRRKAEARTVSGS